MTWPMWLLTGIPFAISFAIMVGCAIAEYRREAPVDTYRRLTIVDKHGVERPDVTMPDRNIRGWL